MPRTDEMREGGARSHLVLFGIGLAFVGLLVFWWASPSPHGYIELFVALPTIGAGVLVGGIGLVRLENPVLKAFGWLVLIGLVAASALLLLTA